MLKNRGDTWAFSALYIIIKKVRKNKKRKKGRSFHSTINIIIKKVRKIQRKKKAVVSPLQCDMNNEYYT